MITYRSRSVSPGPRGYRTEVRTVRSTSVGPIETRTYDYTPSSLPVTRTYYYTTTEPSFYSSAYPRSYYFPRHYSLDLPYYYPRYTSPYYSSLYSPYYYSPYVSSYSSYLPLSVRYPYLYSRIYV